MFLLASFLSDEARLNDQHNQSVAASLKDEIKHEFNDRFSDSIIQSTCVLLWLQWKLFIMDILEPVIFGPFLLLYRGCPLFGGLH